MTMALEHVVGGTYNGSGASPTSGTVGTITTDGPDREIVIIAVSGRDNTTTDFQRVTAISASGLTFVNKLSQDFHWTDNADVGFPVGSMHMDIFTAHASAQLTGLTWSSTITGDGFVNNGAGFVLPVSGASVSAPIDTNAANFSFSSNVSGPASAPSISGISTDATDVLLLMPIVQHKLGGGGSTITAPSGWSLQGPVLANLGAAASQFNMAVAFKELGKQTTATFTAGSSDDFWGTAIAALAAQATNPTKTQMLVLT